MQALILNGAIGEDKVADNVILSFTQVLQGMGWDVTPINMQDKKIASCLGCYSCWIQTPGRCIIDDDGGEIVRRFVQSQLTVLLTPVTFGGYSSQIKKGLDRNAAIIMPYIVKNGRELRCAGRYKDNPRLLGVGLLPGPDEESETIFRTLVKRNANNFYSPASAAGFVYREWAEAEIKEVVFNLLAAVGVNNG